MSERILRTSDLRGQIKYSNRTTIMNSSKTCPICDAEFAKNRRGGVGPACLLRAALQPEPVAEEQSSAP